jgi:hypothetical protein
MQLWPITHHNDFTRDMIIRYGREASMIRFSCVTFLSRWKCRMPSVRRHTASENPHNLKYPRDLDRFSKKIRRKFTWFGQCHRGSRRTSINVERTQFSFGMSMCRRLVTHIDLPRTRYFEATDERGRFVLYYRSSISRTEAEAPHLIDDDVCPFPL